ncbi:hypothetical protein EPUS_06716 [Endocarpon pusillum Z07020]|uniref:Uncharacterized protein n=1 Tax=Endocarpon pusillum (strain Z07020 / HMAS-L-300199) TaxID=1263415 RepID=U1GGM7_ENDPU|nr:uncharacterized protein EPUS_06716 [Endocarpon pusillum Z07020]ERF70931.1 hypothetical protein EPUS_06716 [Endocarpon pusillum Z07020]
MSLHWGTYRVFQASLQDSVSLIASRKDYMSVDKNLQILQAVNEIDEQQQAITTLKFRYLLENLPGSAYTYIDTLNSRWRAFWRDITTEFGGSRKRGGNGRRGVTRRRDGRRGRRDGRKEDATTAEGTAATEGATAIEDNHTTTKPGPDKLFGGPFESKIEAKGQELYSDLSEIINRYKGNTYKFDDMLFGPVTADILRALAPNLNKSAELDWDKEPLQYSHFVKAKEERRKREKQKKRKKNQARPSQEQKRIRNLTGIRSSKLDCSGWSDWRRRGPRTQVSFPGCGSGLVERLTIQKTKPNRITGLCPKYP